MFKINLLYSSAVPEAPARSLPQALMLTIGIITAHASLASLCVLKAIVFKRVAGIKDRWTTRQE